jgi:hypothetical protein
LTIYYILGGGAADRRGASAPAAKLKEGCDPNAALEGLGKPAKWCPLKGEWLDVAPKNNSGKKRKKPE